MTELQLKDGGSDIFVIPAGAEESYDFQGTFAQNLGSTGELFISFNRGSKMKFETGLGRITNGGAEYTSIQLQNKTGADITCEMAYGFGDVRDQRLTASGDVKVVNGTTPFKTDDDETQAKLDSVIAAIQARKTNVDLTNATYASVANTTNTLVTAGANTAGVIIHSATWHSYNNIEGTVIVDGNTITPKGQGTTAGTYGGIIENYFIPAGQSVAIYTNNANVTISALYEVL